MPTGYTADIAAGKNTTFANFVWNCARNFGACAHVRDEPLSGVRPRPYVPGSYSQEALAEATRRLDELENMDSHEIAAARNADQDRTLAARAALQEETLLRKSRYDSMLDKVIAWEPPTPDHEKLKTFMLEQLLEGRRFDTETVDPFEVYPDHPGPDAWYEAARETLLREIAYCTSAVQEGLDRAKENNDWIDALANSLDHRPDVALAT